MTASALKTQKVIIVFAALVALLVGCANPTFTADPVPETPVEAAAAPAAPRPGTLEVLLTDWPLGDQEVTALWIEIQSIAIHGEENGWLTFTPQQSAVDLIQLVDDVSRVGIYDLPPDRYTQIRLVLGADNRIVFGQQEPVPLFVPSGQQSGVKIVGGFDLPAGYTAKILLDFDAQRSVKQRGGAGKKGSAAQYLLTPAISIKETVLEPIETKGPDYPRLVVETYSPNDAFTADTYVDLFDAAGDPDADDPWTGDDTGDALAHDDDGNLAYAGMSRIDYAPQDGVPPGTYYIRVRGATAEVDDFYAIRVLVLEAGAQLPPYDFNLHVATRPDVVDSVPPGDDLPPSGGIPLSPVPIELGVPQSRSLDYTDSTGDIDWFRLVLP